MQPELLVRAAVSDKFFARYGYAIKIRTDAPSAIQNTAEFASLCPGDAVLMYKSLL